ncbi:hypothetical protein RHSIM_Rhsim09G0030600 [Rhododendron simsii]|uniref:Nuclease HARBI1 n=1 Tax=Rhododendron simsii TaxID=118357 RepID=A0A834LDY6_RHOSS|nr:hypothetical protein RHSIM_Rhsim09G0030600 [Rhododendron simsii]
MTARKLRRKLIDAGGSPGKSSATVPELVIRDRRRSREMEKKNCIFVSFIPFTPSFFIMAPNRLLNLIMNNSDFSDLDNELEIFQAVATYESERNSSSSRNRCTVINRNTFGAQNRFFDDYFAESPVFPPHYFQRRFRMSRSLFLHIHDAVKAHGPYFIQKRNAAKKLGLSSLQKMIAAFKMLAYGAPADSVDEYVRIGATTALKSLRRILRAVIEVFSEEYLRSPNATDVARLLAVGELRGFPGMLGSLDCMHWEWKNCPTAWQGIYTGHAHKPTLILEAIASYDLWIWHANFELPRSHNDLNVLDRSSLFDEFSLGRTPPVNYTINGNEYNMGYYLVDGRSTSTKLSITTLLSLRFIVSGLKRPDVVPILGRFN